MHAADETGGIADSNLVAFAASSQTSGTRKSWDGFWDGVQGTLDVAGLYPAAGIIPDGINTDISAGRGRWGEASMNLSAMVPIFGQFSKGGQLANKARKALQKGGTKGKKLLKKASTAKKVAPKKGIYEFPDKKTPGKDYVGQSSNIDKRLKKHQHDGRLEPGTETITEVGGGKTAREIAEHKRIQQKTEGVPARKSNKVSNKKDPIGPNRKDLLNE